MFIAIYGADGSGKSTLINLLEDELDNFCVYHFKPEIFSKLLSRFLNNDRIISNGRPYKAESYGKILGITKIVYYVSEYVIFGIYIRLVKRKKHIIFDRYYLDLCIDSRRARLVGLESIVMFLYKIVPKPDLEVVLVGEAQKINQRKPELTIEEIDLLQSSYVKKIRCGLILDSTAQSPETICSGVMSKINEKINS